MPLFCFIKWLLSSFGSAYLYVFDFLLFKKSIYSLKKSSKKLSLRPMCLIQIGKVFLCKNYSNVFLIKSALSKHTWLKKARKHKSYNSCLHIKQRQKTKGYVRLEVMLRLIVDPVVQATH